MCGDKFRQVALWPRGHVARWLQNSARSGATSARATAMNLDCIICIYCASAAQIVEYIYSPTQSDNYIIRMRLWKCDFKLHLHRYYKFLENFMDMSKLTTIKLLASASLYLFSIILIPMYLLDVRGNPIVPTECSNTISISNTIDWDI